jgi:hypothetical protein
VKVQKELKQRLNPSRSNKCNFVKVEHFNKVLSHASEANMRAHAALRKILFEKLVSLPINAI